MAALEGLVAAIEVRHDVVTRMFHAHPTCLQLFDVLTDYPKVRGRLASSGYSLTLAIDRVRLTRAQLFRT